MSIIVYQWVKTYVPKDSIECSDGVSLFVKDYTYDCDAKNLVLTLKNNGRFNVAGYFIHATTTEDQKLAVTDLSIYNADNGNGGAVIYPPVGGDENSQKPGVEMNGIFDLNSLEGRIYSLEVIPMRYETIDNRNRVVSCTEGKIEQKLICEGSASEEGGTAGACGDGTEDVQSGEECDDGELNGNNNNACILDTEGSYLCKDAFCGDGYVWNTEGGTEQCDDGINPPQSEDGCSNSCQIETGWSCAGTPSVCGKNWVSLFEERFSSTDPDSPGPWRRVCAGSCNTQDSDIDSVDDSNNCNADSSCGTYYMRTKDEVAATKSISTEGYESIRLDYYRRSDSSSGSDKMIVEWKIGPGDTGFTLIFSEDLIATWGDKHYEFPSTANNQQEIQIRFWRDDSGESEYSYWDNINVSAQIL